VLAAQNTVVMMLASRVITPSVLRAAQKEGPGIGLSERMSELSRLLQRVAHFAHHGDEDDYGTSTAVGPSDLQQVLKHVAAMRELVAKVLTLPADPTLGLAVPAEEAEDAAAWIVKACQSWSAGLAASGGLAGSSRPRSQQQLEAARPVLLRLAALSEPTVAGSALPGNTPHDPAPSSASLAPPGMLGTPPRGGGRIPPPPQ